MALGTARDGASTLLWAAVPGPHCPRGEEFLPGIQPKSTLLLYPFTLVPTLPFFLLLFSLKHAHEKKEKYYVLCVASASQKMILTGGKEGEKIQKLPIAAHAHGNKMWST